jgi:hypothetical protein
MVRHQKHVMMEVCGSLLGVLNEVLVMNLLSMINFHNHEESNYLTLLDGIYEPIMLLHVFAILDPFKVDGS